MTRKAFLNVRIGFTIMVSLALISLLLWQYLGTGIPAHYFLANKNMPLISNVWGGVAVPVFTWIMLWRIERRIFGDSESIPFPKFTVAGFAGALLYGVVLGVSIDIGLREVSGNTPWIIMAAALFFPVYRAEYFLGFVLGLTYWVGGLLPIVVGSVFLAVAYIIYNYIRRPALTLLSRRTN